MCAVMWSKIWVVERDQNCPLIYSSSTEVHMDAYARMLGHQAYADLYVACACNRMGSAVDLSDGFVVGDWCELSNGRDMYTQSQ
jgi:hypothetical protein